MVTPLLTEGAIVNAKAGICGYALQAAAKGRHVSVTRLLLDYGAEVNASAPSGSTALQEAVTCYSQETALPELVELLVERGADVNLSRTPESGPLVLAASSAEVSIVEFLLDHDAEERYYGHALQLAARCGHYCVTSIYCSAVVWMLTGWEGSTELH